MMRICFWICLLVIGLVSMDASDDEICEKDGACYVNRHQNSGTYTKNFNQDTDGKWGKYILQIESAMSQYTECRYENCSCHANMIDDGLNVWENEEKGITRDMVETAAVFGVHYQIINHTLYREDNCTYEPRCSGVELFVQEIIQDLPDMEFVINIENLPKFPKKSKPLPIFSFSKKAAQHLDILCPAWTFSGHDPVILPIYPNGIGRWDKQMGYSSTKILWPALYSTACLHNLSALIPNSAFKVYKGAAADWPWEKKLEKGFFLGSRTTATRDPLILLSEKEPELLDARYTQHAGWEIDTMGREPATANALEDNCKYRYLFNIFGHSASFRFKYLFLCQSLVFHVSGDWLEFFYPAMRPWVHFVPLSNDLADAKELLQFARENDEVVYQIAERGQQFILNHLKMEDVICYWSKLLRRYASLLTYKPRRREAYAQVKRQPPIEEWPEY